MLLISIVVRYTDYYSKKRYYHFHVLLSSLYGGDISGPDLLTGDSSATSNSPIRFTRQGIFTRATVDGLLYPVHVICSTY